MPLPIQIDFHVQAEGVLQASLLSILPNGVLVCRKDLDVVCEGDILVAGSIRIEPGASLSLASRKGNVIVTGQIAAVRARDATAPGKPGEDGGSVSVTALEGEIVIAGSIEAGHGGDGGNARNDPKPADTRSGKGGNGGGVTLQGFYVSLRGGTLKAGSGGKGGTAEADGWDFNAMFNWFRENVMPAGGPMDLPPVNPPEPPLVVAPDEVAEKLVTAVSGDGGKGGDVRLAAATHGSLGWMTAGSNLVAGDGGNARTAAALRGTEARAMVGSPGIGGKVLYVAAPGGALGVWQRSATETPGAGGSAERAAAAALKIAEARVSAAGAGGKVVVEGLAPTSLQGAGGNTGQALAQTLSCTQQDGPFSGGPNGPAGPAVAIC